MIKGFWRVGLSFGLYGLVCVASPTRADPIEDFYKGKTLEMMIPASAGGDYDIRGRMLARHLPRFIPGKPTVVARNMPGGIGVAAANYMTKIAPKDGTALQIIFQNMPSLQGMGSAGVEYDVRRFGWIGNTTNSPNVITAWHATGVKTIHDVMQRELVVGAPGAASTSYIYPAALNQLVGTKFKIIAGYPGGNDVNLAMEKGEVGGRGSNSWASWKSGHPHWIAEKKIYNLVQIALERAPDLPDVPLMLELARNEEDKQVLTFLSADMGISRAFTTTPDVPAERLAALRRAFDLLMKDPDFLAEAERAKMDLVPSSGEAAQKVAESMLANPPRVFQRAKAIIESGAK